MTGPVERFVKWEFIPGLPRNLGTPSLIKDYENGFRFTLAECYSDGRAFSVEFERPLAFRCANESYRLKLIETLQAELPWPTFKVENSKWVEWFHEQTLEIYRDWKVEYYAFIGEDIVEVLSSHEPSCSEIKRASTFGWIPKKPNA